MYKFAQTSLIKGILKIKAKLIISAKLFLFNFSRQEFLELQGSQFKKVRVRLGSQVNKHRYLYFDPRTKNTLK